jgi:hypothetical protein
MPAPTPPNAEKILDWAFKITTALIIPTLIWSLKMSNQITELNGKIEKIESASEIERKHLNRRVELLESHISEVGDLKAKVVRNETRTDGLDDKLKSASDSMSNIYKMLVELLKGR